MSRQQIFDKKAMPHVDCELEILRTLPALRSPHQILSADTHTICALMSFLFSCTQKQVLDRDVRHLARLSQHLHPHALCRGRRTAAFDQQRRDPRRGCVHTVSQTVRAIFADLCGISFSRQTVVRYFYVLCMFP